MWKAGAKNVKWKAKMKSTGKQNGVYEATKCVCDTVQSPRESSI